MGLPYLTKRSPIVPHVTFFADASGIFREYHWWSRAIKHWADIDIHIGPFPYRRSRKPRRFRPRSPRLMRE